MCVCMCVCVCVCLVVCTSVCVHRPETKQNIAINSQSHATLFSPGFVKHTVCTARVPPEKIKIYVDIANKVKNVFMRVDGAVCTQLKKTKKTSYIKNTLLLLFYTQECRTYNLRHYKSYFCCSKC